MKVIDSGYKIDLHINSVLLRGVSFGNYLII